MVHMCQLKCHMEQGRLNQNLPSCWIPPLVLELKSADNVVRRQQTRCL